MKEAIHQQISRELKLATRLDLVTVIVAVAVTLILFGVAAGSAAGTVGSLTGGLTSGLTSGILGQQKTVTFNTVPTIIMFIVLIVLFVINWYAVRALLNHKKQRAKMTEGLMMLYKDEGVEQYYDGSIFKTYETRYNLFAVIVGAVGALSVIVPLVIFIDKLTSL